MLQKFGKIIKETNKAILFSLDISIGNKTYNISKWLSKSKIYIIRFEHYIQVNMPRWAFLKYKNEAKKKYKNETSQLELNPVVFYPDI